MLKTISLLFALTLFCLGCTAQEQTSPKIRRPYPDVWGYDLSDYPALKCDTGDIDVYRMDDGDIWFIISHSYKIADPMKTGSDTRYTDEKFILLKFLTGERKELNTQERHELYAITKGKKLTLPDQVYFSDGSSLKSGHTQGPKLCFTPDFITNYLIKINTKREEKKYSILGVNSQVEIFTDQAACDFKGAPFFYSKLYPFYGLIDLGDDTFIAYAQGGNVILRFDKNFNTKFKPVTPVATMHGNFINRNFFIIEYALIEEIEKKLIHMEVPLYQSIHDELLLYLKNKYPMNPN